MFFRLSTLLPIAALASVVSAGALEARNGKCDTGTQACCNQVLQSNNAAVAVVAGALNVVLPIVPVLAGLTCTLDLGACTQSPVCCDKVYGSGLLVVQCNSINL